MFWMLRPFNKLNFPLITRFIFTGESLNPWRCECCATKKQRKAADSKTGHPVNAHNVAPINACCRKCGVDF